MAVPSLKNSGFETTEKSRLFFLPEIRSIIFFTSVLVPGTTVLRLLPNDNCFSVLSL